MKVAAYYRVSTAGQGEDDRYGLPAQRDAVEKYCVEHGHQIVATFEDVGYSGATADRPGLARLLLGGEFEAVVAYSWDRYARDNRLDGHIRYTLGTRGVTVLSATQENGIDPTSVMVQVILSAVAGFERSLIAQRMAAGRRAKHARGGYGSGQARFGTRAERGTKVLHEDHEESATLATMQRLRDQGASYRAIANSLNEQGARPRRAAQWNHVSVWSALKAAGRAAAFEGSAAG